MGRLRNITVSLSQLALLREDGGEGVGTGGIDEKPLVVYAGVGLLQSPSRERSTSIIATTTTGLLAALLSRHCLVQCPTNKLIYTHSALIYIPPLPLKKSSEGPGT